VSAADTHVETESVISLTETAAEKVNSFLEDQSDVDDIALRVAVQAGGCAGFRYALFFDDRQLDGDHEEEHHGIRVRVDKMSTPVPPRRGDRLEGEPRGLRLLDRAGARGRWRRPAGRRGRSRSASATASTPAR
jgi:hypothetical protein